MRQLRVQIESDGLSGFTTANLALSDLRNMQWAGDALHLEIMREQIERGDPWADTISVYAPNRVPVSKGYVTHDLESGHSTVSQLATHPALQSIGLGTFLLNAIEQRIAEVGNTVSVLGVETTNDRAKSLYERLGYVYFKREADSWEATDFDGNTYLHETLVNWLRKVL